MWFVQFFITAWYNQVLILASHDQNDEAVMPHATSDEDWGLFQVKVSYDLKVTGVKHIDCFLTAGLGTHRTHHVLPYQRSAFANIATDPVVKQATIERGEQWYPAKNFILDRFPSILNKFLVTPKRLSREVKTGSASQIPLWQANARAIGTFIFVGFAGVGSI